MSACVPPLLAIATDPTRGTYARIAAARAVIGCGTPEDVSTLWNALLTAEAELPRKLLAEILQGAAADGETVTLLLKSIDKLPPYDSYKATGLRHALHRFIDRLPVSDAHAPQPLEELVSGLQAFLARPPHFERRECRVSEGIRLADGTRHPRRRETGGRTCRCGDARRRPHSHAESSGSPRMAWSTLRQLQGETARTCPSVAGTERSIVLARRQRRANPPGARRKPTSVFVQVTWHDRYWSFGPDSFPRVLNWLSTRELEDDRLVALSLALSMYREADEPAEWLDELRAAVKSDAVLMARLEEWLNPTTSEADLEWERKSLQLKQKHDQQRQEREQARSEWIASLKADPDRVRNPPGLQPGEITNDQYWLLREIDGDGLRTTRTKGADWQSLAKSSEWTSPLRFATLPWSTGANSRRGSLRKAPIPPEFPMD